MNEGGVSAVHVTICYHEDFRETVANMSAWYERFVDYSDHIFLGTEAADVDRENFLKALDCYATYQDRIEKSGIRKSKNKNVYHMVND